jgi:hypothetical protein
MASSGHTRIISGGDLRRLLVLRSRVRDRIVDAPRAVQREVLRSLEEARRLRLDGRVESWTPPALAPGELLREIKWRIDVASLPEADAAARVLDRAARDAARRQRVGSPILGQHPGRGVHPHGGGAGPGPARSGKAGR